MASEPSPEELDRRQSRRRIESDLFALEAESSGMVRRRDDQIVLLQNLRQKERLAQAQVTEAETELERFEARILEKQGEIDRLKKKLRLL